MPAPSLYKNEILTKYRVIDSRLVVKEEDGKRMF